MNAMNRPLRRSTQNRQIAGVCAGIAHYFSLNATNVRIVYLLATIFTAFAGSIVYIILWMVIPPDTDH